MSRPFLLTAKRMLAVYYMFEERGYNGSDILEIINYSQDEDKHVKKSTIYAIKNTVKNSLDNDKKSILGFVNDAGLKELVNKEIDRLVRKYNDKEPLIRKNKDGLIILEKDVILEKTKDGFRVVEVIENGKED